MSDQRIFEYGGFWLAQVAGSAAYYACWYDPSRRRTCRCSLGTEELEEAKRRLIERAGTAGLDVTRSPERVMIASVLDHYCDHHSDGRASAFQARRAAEVVNQFLAEQGDIAAKVASFGPIRQRQFMAWSQATLNHSPATIARNLSVVSAAFRFAASLHQITDGFGRQAEVFLLDQAPSVVTNGSSVAQLLNVAESTSTDWLPTFDEFGRFLDELRQRQELTFRYSMMALSTWGRPEAIMDIRVGAQVDFENGLLDLNPPGRRQTDKWRPTIRLTDNLRGWLEHWGQEAPMMWNDQPVKSVKRTWQRHALACGLPQFTRYTIRHFMATKVRRARPPVPTEERSQWLGHVGDRANRTTRMYEKFDPDYLADCARATDWIIAELQDHTRRTLDARKLRANVGVIRASSALRHPTKLLKLNGEMVGATGIEPVTPTMST